MVASSRVVEREGSPEAQSCPEEVALVGPNREVEAFPGVPYQVVASLEVVPYPFLGVHNRLDPCEPVHHRQVP